MVAPLIYKKKYGFKLYITFINLYHLVIFFSFFEKSFFGLHYLFILHVAVASHDVAASKEQAKYSILFKLQTNKDFNKDAFKSTCANLWRASHGVNIKEVGQNLFLAIFVSEEHLEIVFDVKGFQGMSVQPRSHLLNLLFGFVSLIFLLRV